MGDFGRVGTASLWKSGPFFSTDAERPWLKTVVLRLNLCLRAGNSMIASRAREQEEMNGDLEPRLSTGFAKAHDPLPPALQGQVDWS